MTACPAACGLAAAAVLPWPGANQLRSRQISKKPTSRIAAPMPMPIHSRQLSAAVTGAGRRTWPDGRAGPVGRADLPALLDGGPSRLARSRGDLFPALACCCGTGGKGMKVGDLAAAAGGLDGVSGRMGAACRAGGGVAGLASGRGAAGRASERGVGVAGVFAGAGATCQFLREPDPDDVPGPWETVLASP